MAGINLLPEEQSEKSYTTKIGSRAKKVITYVVVLVLVLFVAVGGFYGYYYVLDNLAVRSTVNLENQIQALQPVEQKIVLLRDRLRKSSKILAAPTSLDESVSLTSIISALPEGVSITGTTIKTDEFNVLISATESKKITDFIHALTFNDTYQKIEVSSLAFNPKEGYRAEIRLVNRAAH